MLGIYWKEFDPFGWLGKYISSSLLHCLIRMCFIALLLFFLYHRVSQYELYLVKPLWFVETLIFVVFIVSYMVRLDPVERSRDGTEIIVPLTGGVLPFTLLFSPPSGAIAVQRLMLQIIFYWMTAATAFTVWGLWTIRRSFSITVEARSLVTIGPYRWIRHPIYLGEILTAFAVTVWRFSLLNIVIFTAFVVIQLFRARWEEEKLVRVFPAYREYCTKTKWL